MKRKRLIGAKEWLVLAGIVAVCILAGVLTDRSSILKTLCRIAIMALYALSLNIQYGYGGMANLGSSLYFAISGYGMMVFVTRLGFPLWGAVLVTLLIEVVFAFAFGYVTLQRGMMTFMFLNMGIVLLAVGFVSKTAYLGAVTGIMYTICPPWLTNMNVRYFFVAGVCILCGFLLYLFTKSPMVAVLKGARDNEERLLFLGINAKKLRLVIFVITSVFMGVAGFLYTIVYNNMNTKMLDSAISIQALVMCIIGGSAYYLGPVLGSVVVTLIVTYAPLFTPYHQSVLAVCMLLVIYFAPKGLLDVGAKAVGLVRSRLAGRSAVPERQEEK